MRNGALGQLRQLGDIRRNPTRLVLREVAWPPIAALGSSSNTPKFGPVCAKASPQFRMSVCAVLSGQGRDYDEAKSNKDCQFLFIFLAVGLCTGPCTGAATGPDRTTVTPVYVCA